MLKQIGVDIAALQGLVRRHPIREFDDLDIKPLLPGARRGKLDDFGNGTARRADLQRLGGRGRRYRPLARQSQKAHHRNRKQFASTIARPGILAHLYPLNRWLRNRYRHGGSIGYIAAHAAMPMRRPDM
jgi:hypothetical protein